MEHFLFQKIISDKNNQDSEDSCMTTGGPEPNAPCQFPFNYNGKLYDGCTAIDKGCDEKWSCKWCSTEVGPNRGYIRNKWGFCNADCPATTGIKF